MAGVMYTARWVRGVQQAGAAGGRTCQVQESGMHITALST
jgi:hypothetical protein